MSKKYLIPFALILMLVLAACGGQQTAEPGVAEAAANQPAADADDGSSMDEMANDHDDTMAESSSDDMADTDEDHDDDMDKSHDDDMDEMAEDHDDDMDKSSMDEADEAAEMEMADEDDNMEASTAATMDLPLWQTLAVTNAATGEPFSLGDFQGKTVFVEPMATWCSNCRKQQGHVQQAKMQLGDDVVFVGLSLETTLPAAELARYAQGNGFDWTYAVLSEELLAVLVDEFGRSITSAPSTPHFVIYPDGSFSELSTGIHSAEEIIAQIEGAQS